MPYSEPGRNRASQRERERERVNVEFCVYVSIYIDSVSRDGESGVCGERGRNVVALWAVWNRVWWDLLAE